MTSPLALAEAAAREAGALLLELARSPRAVEKKGAIDLVTDADRAAEKAILARVRAAFPDHAIMAEESGGAVRGLTWIVDPLDGTTNFAHGFPQWCVSIALADGEEPLVGVIFDPVKDELFAAERGRGATLNGRALRVSAARKLDDAILATGFPYDRRERADFYLPFYRAAVIATQGVRRAGAAALDLAWTACGRVDGYFEFGVRAWDVAAGSLLVREAGGRVSDMKGGPLLLDGRNIAVSNGAIHDELLAMIATAWPAPPRAS